MAVPRPGNKPTNGKRMANRPANGHNMMRRFRPGNQPRQMNMGGIGAMFNILNNTNSQIPSNGYLDFTEPSNNMSNANNGQKQFKNNSNNANGSTTNGTNNKNRNIQRRNNNGQRSSNGGMRNNRWGTNNRGGMGNNNNRNNNNMNSNMRQGGMMMGGQFNGPPRMHPMGPNGPPMPQLQMPIHNMSGRFPPRPLMPPPMGQGPLRPPSFRMGPFSNRGMMPRNNAGGPIRRNNKVSGGMVNKNNRRNGGNAQPSQKNRKKNQIKNGKRANINKYAMDKPWVNDEIKKAHQVKTDLEDQLKGKKNDEIFAKFKEQRDIFVSLYDAAKEAFLTTQKKVNI